LEQFASDRKLDPDVLARWINCLSEHEPQPALLPVRDAPDQPTAEASASALISQLKQVASNRQSAAARDPVASMLAELPLLSFRADDRLNLKNGAALVANWPNRGTGPPAATAVPDVPAPAVSQAMLRGTARKVLRFSGNELLQASLPAPQAGTLAVVFCPDPMGPAGQRLIGWEDSDVGQHGLGIMTDAAGSLHVVARRGGSSGDIMVPPLPSGPTEDGWQILTVTWGSAGVAVFRNGTAAGTSQGIDSISSDPAITALRIGGPGSGGSGRFHGDIAELRVYGLPLDEPARMRVESELSLRWREPPESAPQRDPVAELYAELISASSPYRLEGVARDAVLPEDFRQRLEAARDELQALKRKSPPEIPKAVVVQEGGPPDTPHAGFHDAKIFLRGNHSKPGSDVPRGVPKAIAGATPFEIREGSGRRELAGWLTDPANPLTARVLVNRVWQHHFGVGLVSTSANLGALGERPSHPELLDYLAARFIASGWSIKSLHRLIMLSQVYQQTSAADPAGLGADPENRLLWRANRRRLESEALRDSLFAVAGRLDLAPSGPPFTDGSTPRRSLYLLTSRTGAKSAEFGPLFDAPDCSGIVERRTESIVAPQALFLMNDPLVSELAGALARRIEREVPGDSVRDRISRLYELALGRLPVAEEIDVGLGFVTGGSAAAVANAWTGYCRLVLCTNEFLYVD
jgi:hypothetical protein